MLRQARWLEARAVLAQAEDRLGPEGESGQRRLLDQARRDLDLVDRLDAVRVAKATLVGGKYDYKSAAASYQAAFREAGLADDGEDAAAVADRVRASVIGDHLVASLDDWAGTAARPQRAWVLDVARRADPAEGRDRFRDPTAWEDRAALQLLTAEADPTLLPPHLLAALGDRLKKTGADPIPFLKKAQQAHPEDFWLNLHLGNNLALAGRGAGAAEFFRAATIVRPGVAAAWANLGASLVQGSRFEDAVAALEKAIELDPSHAGAHANLGAALGEMARPREGLAALDRAVALDPSDAKFHYNRGLLLSDLKRGPEAADAYRKAIELAPKQAAAYLALGEVLAGQGAGAEAIESYRRAVAHEPRLAGAHHALGVALSPRGQYDEAIDPLRQAARLAPNRAETHYALGVALAVRGRGDEALAAYLQAAACDPALGPAHYNVGWCLLQRGQREGAAEAFRRALVGDPKDAQTHKALVQALLGQGRFEEARAAARRGFEQLPEGATARSSMTKLLERCGRLAELEGQLPAFVRGERRPAGPAESLLAAEFCRYQQAHATAARLYAEAFVADPELADREGHLDAAACCAAQAGCGQGRDSLTLDGKEQARLRGQSLAWLRANLARLAKRVESTAPEDREEAEATLLDWQGDVELAGVRDEATLARRSEEERAAWREFWAEVGKLRTHAKP